MAPLLFNTPRKDGKTEEQAQSDMSSMLQEYYVQDQASDSVPAPPSTNSLPPKKTKKPASRKAAPRTKAKPNSELQDSPLRRKSTRMAAKRKSSSDSDADDEHETPATKRLKASPVQAPAAQVSPAKVQKHTGRFTPIGSQLKRAKKIQAKPAPAKTVTDDEAMDDDGNAGDDSSAQAKRKTGDNFKGTNTEGMGTSADKPQDAPNDEPWNCANRACTSGQTWHNRDGANSYGRKVISNFFGRNKKETNLIHPNVWHNYCRKDYQRGTYRVNNQSTQQKIEYYTNNIRMQLVRIKLWRPEATFKAQLSKGASTRLGNYYKELTKANGDIARAKKVMAKPAKVNAKGKEKPMTLEDAFPIQQLKQFDDDYAGADKSFDDIEEILTWVDALANAGDIESMPPMEFLINAQSEDEEIIDPVYNYERWAAHEDEKDFATPDGSVAGDKEAYAKDEVQAGNGTEDEADDAEDTTTVKKEKEASPNSLTDDDTDDTESTEPETPTPPAKSNSLFLTPKGRFTPPLSSTYGAKRGSGIVNKGTRSPTKSDDKTILSSQSKHK